MSMFSPKVSIGDFNKMKEGLGGAKVPGGDYEVTGVPELRHVEPNEKMKGCGMFVVGFRVNESNENADTHGKVIEETFRYHPQPPADNMVQMNEIMLQNMAKLIDACQFEPTTGPDGNVDIIENLKAVLATEPVLWVTVERTTEGYQNIGNFRPSAG